MRDIIKKIKKENLLGRGGACYPVADKWQAVKKARGKRKFVVCNASEGEPDVKKDLYLLEKHAGKVINGMRMAIEYTGAEKGYLYLNPEYYDKLADRLEKLIGQIEIDVFRKPHRAGYIGGEETSALNTLEGKRTEPRMRPPFPPESGLWGFPTLVNNVETFYDVFLIGSGKYRQTRVFSVGGDVLWPKVFELPEDTTIKEVLQKTDNLPEFDYFVQVGGGASGLVLDQSQCGVPVTGSASIAVYSKIKHDPMSLLQKWLKFFRAESCGKCTPCREGTLRLYELSQEKEPDWQRFASILDALAESSFCGLGCSVPIPIRSYIDNVLSKDRKNQIVLPDGVKRYLCECLK